MTSIAYRDICGGGMKIYKKGYPAQRSLFEETRNERIINALEELKGVGNIKIYLYKKGKFREIADRTVKGCGYLKMIFTEI